MDRMPIKVVELRIAELYAAGGDLTKFIECATGAGILYTGGAIPPTCTLTLEAIGLLKPDTDGDGDIDMEDFGLFQRCYSGEATPPTLPARAERRGTLGIDGLT